MRVIVNCGLLIGDLGALCAVLYGGELFLRDPTRSGTAMAAIVAGLIGWSLLSLTGRRIDNLMESTRDIKPLFDETIENIS